LLARDLATRNTLASVSTDLVGLSRWRIVVRVILAIRAFFDSPLPPIAPEVLINLHYERIGIREVFEVVERCITYRCFRVPVKLVW